MKVFTKIFLSLFAFIFTGLSIPQTSLAFINDHFETYQAYRPNALFKENIEIDKNSLPDGVRILSGYFLENINAEDCLIFHYNDWGNDKIEQICPDLSLLTPEGNDKIFRPVFDLTKAMNFKQGRPNIYFEKSPKKIQVPEPAHFFVPVKYKGSEINILGKINYEINQHWESSSQKEYDKAFCQRNPYNEVCEKGIKGFFVKIKRIFGF